MRLTPTEACKKFCTFCLGLERYNTRIIKDCQGDKCACGPCPLYKNRLGTRISAKVIRKHCLYCMGGSSNSVMDCETTECELYLYRLGKNPAYKNRKAPVHGRFSVQG